MPASQQPVPSVWARPRTKREHPALSRERIVSEAVKLLDEEGIEALSMRSLGTRLNAGATSLYRHMANKDELIELVVDEVYGELRVPVVREPARWREAAGEFAHRVRAMILRHPWLASVLGQVGLADLGPNLAEQSERMLALFKAAGFDPGEADLASNALLAYVIGMTTSEAAYFSMLARSGRTEAELMKSLRHAAEHSVEGHPLMKEVLEETSAEDPQVVRDRQFEYGVQRILDGLGTRLA